jgi:hypothetical protein
MILYLPAILLFWSCALASKTYKYFPIYLGRYLHNIDRETSIRGIKSVNWSPRVLKSRVLHIQTGAILLDTLVSFKKEMDISYKFRLLIPMTLPLCCDFSLGLSLMECFWYVTLELCDPIASLEFPYMLGLLVVVGTRTWWHVMD